MPPDILETTDEQTQENNQPRSRLVSKHNGSSDNQSTSNHSNENSQDTFKPQIRWPDLIVQIVIHVGALYGFYYLVTLQAKFYTYIWCESVFISF